MKFRQQQICFYVGTRYFQRVACGILSATEHHALQQEGPVKRKKREEDVEDEEAPCLEPAATDKITARELNKTYCYSDRKSFFFFKTMNPCMPAWGVHTVLWEGFELTQVTVAPSVVWRRRGEDELFNQPAPLGSDVLLLFYGEVRWTADIKQHLLTQLPSSHNIHRAHPARNLKFSRGQGIISQSSSGIIAPSQNDSHRCDTPSQIAGLSLPTHRMKWQPCPSDSAASQPE